MNKRQFKANEKYLEEHNVVLEDTPVWEDDPFSYDLGYSTPSGGDFTLTLQELSKECMINTLKNYDVNEETMQWWGSRGLPFDNIKDLYDDIEQWRVELLEIAKNMPY
jgi:hypothetical protein